MISSQFWTGNIYVTYVENPERESRTYCMLTLNHACGNGMSQRFRLSEWYSNVSG